MMIRRSAACRCVRTSWSVFKLNQTCFVESSLVMRHEFLSSTWKPSARAVNGSLRPHRGRKKSRQSKSKVKVMLFTFCDVRGIVHSEFLPQGQTISQQVCKEILRLLLRSVREKRRELRQDKSWLLHHDNASAHNALSIRQFLAEKNITVLEKPPCSHDLAPCDFLLFPKLKGIINGTHFEGVEAIKRAVTTELSGIPKESFQQCIEAWQRRMEKRIRLEGDYFEGKTM